MVRWVVLCHVLALNFLFASGSGLLYAAEPPKALHWETNANPTPIGSPKALTGGRLISSIDAFPLTLRQVGPDSSGSFRQLLNDNDMSLITMHPNTDQWVPM